MAGGCRIAVGEWRLVVGMAEDTANMELGLGLAEESACCDSLAQKVYEPAGVPEQEDIEAAALKLLETC